MDRRKHDVLADGVFGFALAPVFASVYYESAVRLAEIDNSEFEAPLILGCVIAHEIGHLLLGPNAHFPAGIMQPEWKREQLNQIMTGRLLFTTEQARIIGAQAQTRLRLQATNITEANHQY